MKTRSQVLAQIFLLVLAVVLLYGGFLWSPIVFDDVYYFIDDTLLRYGRGDFDLGTRWLPYFTLGVSRQLFGLNLLGYRLPSLFLHAGVAIALYVFLQQLWRGILPAQEAGRLPYTWLAFFAALIFALHPVAVYGAGYLIERTIVMATLFALLMWWALLRGLDHNRTAWLWASVIFYALALSSKEHVIMAPAVSAALLLVWWRTHRSNRGDTLQSWLLRLAPIFLVYGLMALIVILNVKGILGKIYEPQGADAALQFSDLQLDADLVYPLSVLNQGALFFKYIGLWLAPNPAWMSVDMREPFATSFWAWPQTLGFVAFLAYPLMALALMWRGGRLGLLGFALLAPWLLFATEVSTVRLQEQFVLYRSYLWAASAFAGLVVLFGLMKSRHAVMGLGLFSLLMFPLAYQRLQTFSHPLLLWDDAAQLVEGKDKRIGLARIYFNRGHALEGVGLSEMAIADYTRALQEKTDYYRPYLLSDRGASNLSLKRYPEALRDFDAAIALKQDNERAYMGRGLALEAMQQPGPALPSFRRACQLGWQGACKKL